jgi:hypothetical protein
MNVNGYSPLWSFATARFVVELYALEEDLDPSDSFENEEDVEFARDGYPAHWFCAYVQVVHIESDTVVGSDSLGACSYRTFRDFYQSHWRSDATDRNCSIMRAARGDNTVICEYFPSMVREAIAHARTTIDSMSL